MSLTNSLCPMGAFNSIYKYEKKDNKDSSNEDKDVADDVMQVDDYSEPDYFTNMYLMVFFRNVCQLNPCTFYFNITLVILVFDSSFTIQSINLLMKIYVI